MGVRYGSTFTRAAQNALPANSSQVLIYLTPPLVMAADTATVLIAWDAVITAGTGATTINIYLFRGATLAGQQLGLGAQWGINCVAGTTYQLSGWYFDQPGVPATQYCLGTLSIGATGAGTLVDGCLMALSL